MSFGYQRPPYLDSQHKMMSIQLYELTFLNHCSLCTSGHETNNYRRNGAARTLVVLEGVSGLPPLPANWASRSAILCSDCAWKCQYICQQQLLQQTTARFAHLNVLKQGCWDHPPSPTAKVQAGVRCLYQSAKILSGRQPPPTMMEAAHVRWLELPPLPSPFEAASSQHRLFVWPSSSWQSVASMYLSAW
jgi:hypothetical protein